MQHFLKDISPFRGYTINFHKKIWLCNFYYPCFMQRFRKIIYSHFGRFLCQLTFWRFLIRKFLIKKMSCIGSTRGATPYRSWVQMCRPGLWVYTPLPPGVWVRILDIFSFPRSMGMIYPNLSYFPYLYSRYPYLLWYKIFGK